MNKELIDKIASMDVRLYKYHVGDELAKEVIALVSTHLHQEVKEAVNPFYALNSHGLNEDCPRNDILDEALKAIDQVFNPKDSEDVK